MNVNGSQNNGNGFHADQNDSQWDGPLQINMDVPSASDSDYSDKIKENEEVSNKESEKYNPFVTFREEPGHFKEIGFWCGIKNARDPHEAFKNTLKELFVLNRDRRADLDISHLFDIERFEEMVFRAEDDIEEIYRKLDEQQDEIPELKKEIENLRKEILKIERDLAAAYQKLGVAKSNLIDKRVSDAFKELDNLTDKYREISKKHSEINKEAKDRNADAFEVKPSLLRHLQGVYTNAFEIIEKKARVLGQNGNWTTNPRYLKTFGLFAACAAGYFFSIFAVESHLGNASISFFVITGLFNFFGALTQSTPVGYFTATLLIILLPFLVLFVAFFCQRALERRKEKQEKRLEDFKVILNENNEVLITEVNEDPYSFLLKNTPYLFVVAILFAFVTFGYFGATGQPAQANAQLDALNISLSSFTIGIGIAFALAGIMYVYIIKIIEPRIVNIDSSEDTDIHLKRSRFVTNLELVGVLLIVLILLATLLIGLEKNFFFDISKVLQNKKAFIAMAFFVASILITAFTFGYGMYFSGIIEAKIGTEKKLKFLTQKLSYNLFPSIKPALLADKTFGIKYLEIVNKLLKLISDKTDLAKQFVPKNEHQLKQQHVARDNSNFLRYLPNFLRKYFHDNRSEYQKLQDDLRDLNNRAELPVEDEHYFPEIATEIKSLDIYLIEQKKRLLITETDIRNRQEEKSDYIKKLNEDKVKFEDKIRDWNKHLSHLNREQFKEIERFNRKYQKEISDLNDGFNLALWFIAGGGKPPLDQVLEKEAQNGRQQ